MFLWLSCSLCLGIGNHVEALSFLMFQLLENNRRKLGGRGSKKKLDWQWLRRNGTTKRAALAKPAASSETWHGSVILIRCDSEQRSVPSDVPSKACQAFPFAIVLENVVSVL